MFMFVTFAGRHAYQVHPLANYVIQISLSLIVIIELHRGPLVKSFDIADFVILQRTKMLKEENTRSH